MTISNGVTPSISRSTSVATVLSPHNSRCFPSRYRSPGFVTGSSGGSGTSSSSVSPADGVGAMRSSMSSRLNPVSSRSKSNPFNSSSSSASRLSSHSAHSTDLLASSRNALICASVSSSARTTGSSFIPSFLAALTRRWPSTICPSDLATTGIRNPNS